jgi:hypothetical protein
MSSRSTSASPSGWHPTAAQIRRYLHAAIEHFGLVVHALSQAQLAGSLDAAIYPDGWIARLRSLPHSCSMASNKNEKPGRAGFPPHADPCQPHPEPSGSEPDPSRPRDDPQPAEPSPSDDDDDDPARPIIAVGQPVVGVAPSFAMGTFLQMSSGAAGIAIQNAVHAQHLQYALNNAANVEALDILRGRHRGASADSRLLATLDRLVRVVDTLEAKAKQTEST